MGILFKHSILAAIDRLEFTWNSRPVATFLCVVGLCGSYWALYTMPAPGISIGLLAAAAGIMSIRQDMKIIERLSWAIILGCLLIAEVRSIHADRANSEIQAQKDRKTQDIKFGNVMDAQQKSFNETSQGLKDSYVQSQKQFDATMRRSNEAINGIQTNLEAVTGSRSFPNYFVDSDPDTNKAYRLSLLVVGSYPIRNMSAGIQTVESKAQNLEIPKDLHCLPCLMDYTNRRKQTARAIQLSDAEALPGIIHPLGESLPPGKYQIDTYSVSGIFTEMLTLELDEKGQLRQKNDVIKQGNPPMIVVDLKLVPAHIVNGKLAPIHNPVTQKGAKQP